MISASNFLLMLSEDEIDSIITDLLDSIRLQHRICKLICKLGSARGDLFNSVDDSGNKAKRVIAAYASLQRKLVEETDLRQEEDLATAIKVASEQLVQRDYNEFFGDDCPDSE